MSATACLALALIGSGSALAADSTKAPSVHIQRIVASSSPDKLIAKGVRVLIDTDSNCRLDASVYLGKTVPGLGNRNARIARGSLISAAGQTSWVTAKLTRHAVAALRNQAGRVSLLLKVRVTASPT